MRTVPRLWSLIPAVSKPVLVSGNQIVWLDVDHWSSLIWLILCLLHILIEKPQALFKHHHQHLVFPLPLSHQRRDSCSWMKRFLSEGGERLQIPCLLLVSTYSTFSPQLLYFLICFNRFLTFRFQVHWDRHGSNACCGIGGHFLFLIYAGGLWMRMENSRTWGMKAYALIP